MAEAGYPLEAAYWFGLAAPAGTPPAILAKLEKALADVLAMPDLRQRMTEMGAVVTPLSSRQFGDYIQVEMRKWADVIEQNKIVFQ
jgi:tripartite-type tricarboxylate transporter receptor subunit TctC